MTGWYQASYQLDIGRRTLEITRYFLHLLLRLHLGLLRRGPSGGMALSAAAAGVIDLALEVVNDAGSEIRGIRDCTYLPPEYAAKCYNNELHLSLNETVATDKTVDDALLTMYLRELEAKLITRTGSLRRFKKELLVLNGSSRALPAVPKDGESECTTVGEEKMGEEEKDATWHQPTIHQSRQ
ncbi:hypothetical protein B0H10DRAFT_2196511 [Mycena sp. CBHHK59/15]|nr:hypothetical protein B0H10DRAFT_2196511 [Mycena sp. CBHHK59/15]